MDSTLIGVIIGGVLTLGSQLSIEGLRAKRERKAAERRDSKELRLAARLVMEELAEAQKLIENAAKSHRYWRAPQMIPTATWNEYRTDLAGAIDPSLDWRYITDAYESLNSLNWTVQHRRLSDQTVDGARLGVFVNAEDGTRETWRSVRRALEALEQAIGVMGPASRLLGEPADTEARCWPDGDGDDFDLEGAMEREEIERQERALRELEE